MHFLETYALNSGLKIDKPYIFEKYTPIEFDDYIAFSYKNYEYFQDVIDIIQPYLNDTKILYIRRSDRNFADCHEISKTDYNQLAYIIGRSKLYFGEPSILTDLASHSGIETVTIYSNTFPQNAFPYWSGKKDFQISVADGSKPYFSAGQNIEALNLIKPEQIAKKILSALNINHNLKHETVYMGSLYQRNDIIVEVVPDNNDPILMENSNFSIRMDLNFDEEYLYNILHLRPLQIWTDKPINIKVLEPLKDHIQQIFYIITDSDCPDFIKSLKQLSIRTKLVTYLEDKDLGRKKLSYIDHEPIITLNEGEKELKNLPINNLFYSSCKVIYENDAYYPSDYARAIKSPIEEPFQINEFKDSDFLLKDLRYFKILSEQS